MHRWYRVRGWGERWARVPVSVKADSARASANRSSATRPERLTRCPRSWSPLPCFARLPATLVPELVFTALWEEKFHHVHADARILVPVPSLSSVNVSAPMRISRRPSPTSSVPRPKSVSIYRIRSYPISLTTVFGSLDSLSRSSNSTSTT